MDRQRRAWLLIREQKPSERWFLLAKGLAAYGASVHRYDRSEDLPRPGPSDILMLWNRRPEHEEAARRFEQCGAFVLVAENAYVSPDAAGREYMAISRGHHNGAGAWPEGDGERWGRMEVPLQPWRGHDPAIGIDIQVCEQRSIGEEGMAMPTGWGSTTRRRLEGMVYRPVMIRKPPSRRPGQKSLGEMLRSTRAVVVWTSNVATLALIYGVPAWYAGPHHIMAPALMRDVGQLEQPIAEPDRNKAFQRMAWAQWTHDEIRSGEAFARLLD